MGHLSLALCLRPAGLFRITFVGAAIGKRQMRSATSTGIMQNIVATLKIQSSWRKQGPRKAQLIFTIQILESTSTRLLLVAPWKNFLLRVRLMGGLVFGTPR